MLGATRQLRPRGNKGAPDNDDGGKQTDGTSKRRVFGDVSNRRRKLLNGGDERKPAAKRSTVSSLVVEGVAKLRRSARSNTDSGESKEAEPNKRLAREQSHNQGEPLEVKYQGGLKKRRSVRKQKEEDVATEVAAQRVTRATRRVERVTSNPRVRSRSRGAKESDETEPDPKGKRRSRSEATVDAEKEPAAKRVKRSSSSKAKKGSETAKPQSKASTTAKATRATVGKRRTRSKAVKDPVKPFSEKRVLCSDFVSDSNFTLVRVPFDPAKYTAGIAKHDEHNKDDPLEVANYVTDLFQRLYHSEELHQPRAYMDDQDEINVMMRAILVDWLVEVHMKFKLTPESLYLCINILDRYCGLVEVGRRKLQLVGVTALLLACKYEEIYPPEVRDCVYITDRAYTRQDVLDMEQDIVKTLKFKLTVPTAYPFLTRFLLVIKLSSEVVESAALYYMERTLQEYDFIQYRPSLVAAAAVCLALNNPQVRAADGTLDGDKPGIPNSLLEYTRYTKGEIYDVANKIAGVLKEEVVTASQRQLLACKKKFDCGKHHHVSTEIDNPDIDDIMG